MKLRDIKHDITYYNYSEDDKSPEYEYWWYLGRGKIYHRYDDEPSWIGYYPNNQVHSKTWYQHGMICRLNGKPSYIRYFDDGKLMTEEWSRPIKDKIRNPHKDLDEHHRIGGPAVIDYFHNGNISRETWSFEGVLHRLDGPAHLMYHENGKIECVEYWVDGECHELNEWLPLSSLTRAEQVEYKLKHG